MSRARSMALAGMVGLLSACAKDKAAPSTQDMANALVAIPETGVPSGVYQRFKYRHQILDSMRADLLTLVAAESSFFADSGRYSAYTSCLEPPTAGAAAWCESRGNTLDGIHVTPRGWWARIVNINTTIFCAVQVGNDTTFGASSGAPVCYGTQPGQPRAF